jgi:hypothetical protein
MANLTDQQKQVVTYLDQHFWETGHLPTYAKAANKLSLSESKIKQHYKDPIFRQALLARGIDLNSLEQDQEDLVTPEQALLANLLFNTHDKRTTREKLQDLNISSQKYHAWLNEPAFQNYLKRRAEALFQNSDHTAYKTLINSIENGNLEATKYFFEMRGIYNPKVQVDVNVEGLLTKVVEIVSKHVTDPTTLEAIATELETNELTGSEQSKELPQQQQQTQTRPERGAFKDVL